MKNFKLLGVTFLVCAASFFQSCDDNDGYSIGDIAIDYVTTHVNSNGVMTFTGDRWGSIWPAASAIVGLKPVDGQRAVLSFNPLYDNYQGYDVAVKIEGLYPVLTKQVEELNASTETDYGDDPVRITDAWIAGGHMNIIFHQRVPKNGPHRVSLVQNTEKEYDEDGYIHLEYRYKTNGDTLSNVVIRSTVSYDLKALDLKDKKGIKMRINSAVNGERELQFDSTNQPVPDNAKDVDSQTSYIN